MSKIKIISAGAGSGKTYRLTEEMVGYLNEGVKPSGIIATTFTKKAAAELQERVRVKLLEKGMTTAANEMTNALIGTVHSVGVKLLHRFAFEVGIAPNVEIMAEEDRKLIFNNALAMVLTTEVTETMYNLCQKLGLSKTEEYDWRNNINYLVDIARVNNLSISDLEKSKINSFESFLPYLGERKPIHSKGLKADLEQAIANTISEIEASGDETAKTTTVVKELRIISYDLQYRGFLYWHQWAKIGKLEAAKKAKPCLEPLQEFAAQHIHFEDFQDDIKQYIDLSFDLVGQAITEFEVYKKQRGWIDYSDMELIMLELLTKPEVCEVLRDELDLLMVDEFQDTSPIQLEIFLKLSALAKNSVWVGDPKQSIYGFRGADPIIMKAIVDKNGGVHPDDVLMDSYRSRPDIVYATNAIFTKSFDMPETQIVLNPKRKDEFLMSDALKLWYFELDPETGKKTTDKPWFANAIATTLKKELEKKLYIMPKGETEMRVAQAGDVAILFKSNADCQAMAEALHKAGLKAAIARNGLLDTQEIRLLMACLRYVLSPADSLSIAEIMVLGSKISTAVMLESRMEYLHAIGEQYDPNEWGKSEDLIIKQLDELRAKVIEYSGSVTLDMILDELDLRRTIIKLGNASQRLDNVEKLRLLTRQYEDRCHRLRSAASLGGLILWLGELPSLKTDMQASGESMDAVQVMTYHKSKGLEWPIVICGSLEAGIKDNVWNPTMVSEGDINIDNILTNRWLRFWVNPYEKLLGGTELERRLSQSEEQLTATKNAIAEDARVLYVGITRARDYLVFPFRQSNGATAWLDRTYTPTKIDTPALDVHSSESGWSWDNHHLNFDNQKVIFPKDFPTVAAVDSAYPYFEERKGEKQFAPYFIKADDEKIEDLFQFRLGAEYKYANSFPRYDDMDVKSVMKHIDLLQIADNQVFDNIKRYEMAQQLLQNMLLDNPQHDLNAALQISADFYQFLTESLAAERIETQVPIRHFFDDRCFETTIDYQIRCADGSLAIIQNMQYEGDDRAKRAKTMRNWAYFVKQSILEKTNEQQAIQIYTNFSISGALVALEIV